ncbi:hypothetical protein LT330_006908 [Penicillium expansum]|nr:hypothetical protein LT330_006908 [Penicillium expansum]
MTKDTSTTTSAAQPTEAAPATPYYGIQETKKLCACEDHQASQWPMEHAVITIPPCAYKCPYCPKFDDRETSVAQVVKLRAHIKRDHLVRLSFVDDLRHTDIYQKKKPDEFIGLSVTPGRVTKPRAPWVTLV